MSLTLYYMPGACSLASHTILAMGNKKYKLEKVDWATHTLEDGSDYYKINPRGRVGTLQLADGSIITQNVALLLYLGKIENLPGMNPDTAESQAILAEALAFISDLLTMYALLLGTKVGADEDAVRNKIYQYLEWLEKWIIKNDQPWWLNKDITQADLYAGVVLSWSPRVGISLDKYPKVRDLYKRVFALPATQKALQEEGLK